MEDKGLDLIIGVDFGTTRSALAFRFLKKNEDLLLTWPDVPGGSSLFKAPTVIMYQKKENNWDPLEIGYTAERKYVSDSKNPNLLLLRKFKLCLNDKVIEGIPVVTVVGDFLRLLKHIANEFLVQKFEGKVSKIDDLKVRWCLTVPAIWTDKEKDVMIKAVIHSGITKSNDPIYSKELVIVLEPEAAAAVFKSNLLSLGKNPESKHVLVVDGGGGTVDLTAHQIIDKNLKELVPGDGNKEGGDLINRNFVEKLEKHFPDIENLRINEKLAWYRTERAFEKQKVSLNQYSPISIFCAKKLLSKADSSKLHEKERFEIDTEDEDDPCVRLNEEQVKDLYSGVVMGVKNKVVSMLSSLREKNLNVDYIFLVGGLLGSKIIRNAVQEVAVGIDVLWPEHPESAIVSGALAFGAQLDMVTSRVVRGAYGIGIRVVYDETKHKGLPTETVSYLVDGKNVTKTYLSNSGFSTFVTRGEEVPLRKAITNSYVVTTPDQSEVTVNIYYWSLNDKVPEFVNAKGMKKLGSITISIPGYGLDRGLKVEFYFGTATLEVQAYDKSNSASPLKLQIELTDE